MRKLIPFLILLLVVLIGAPALAETYVFDDILSTIEIPDNYIILTPNNLDDKAVWLQSRGTTTEALTNDFLKRGVLVQAWSEESDMCLEITAVANERSNRIFDVNEQSESIRGSYRTSHYPDNEYDGYEFTASDWKNTKNGRFLVMKYTRRDSGEILYRGLMRRTIRNGYEITLDLQVYDRNVTTKDNTALNKIWDTYQFVEVKSLPAAASAKINITKIPPTETNDASFAIEGTAAKDVKMIAVIMGLSYPDPIVSEVVVTSNGKIKLPIKLPKEGVFLITVTAEYQGEEVGEFAYPVTYQQSLLTVNFKTEVPTLVTTSELTISGTGEPGASIQIFVNSESIATKKVTGAGQFKIEIDTAEEGPYEVVLAFHKKNLADRRFTFTFNRQWTEVDMLDDLAKQAIKPSYSNLKSKMESYEGRVMGYRAYLLSTNESGDEWISQMAITKNGQKYSGIILVISDEKPSFEIGERIMMYGTCEGMSIDVTGVDGDEAGGSYPCFDLLLFSTLE
ncbi:MAG: hypothetical protein GX096_12905 [Clostridiales bacterium]|nr:hypothetical protein [Clostridiales bacterium]